MNGIDTLAPSNSHELIRQLTPMHGAGEARAIVRLLMEERFHLTQTDVLLGRETDLSPQQHAEFQSLAARLLKGEPVQYVLGHTTFCGHRFLVTPDVLIPRPETEELVRWAIEKMKNERAEKRLLDLCTGSGCIAISLALAFPEALVTALDISPAALDVAQQNARDLGATNVRFLQADVMALAQLSARPNGTLDPSRTFNFSILTANPPYVRDSEAHDMSPTVLQHEPHLALFVPDEDPLCFYRAIADIGQRVLQPGGHVVVELNAALAEQTLQLFEEQKYTALQLRADQFGRTRFLSATKL